MLGTAHGLRRVGGMFGRPDFLAIWGAGVFESVVRWTELLVVGVYTHQVTGSPFLVAVMMFANLVPNALLGTFTGALAERVDRRVLLLGGLGFMAVLMTVTGVLAASGGIELWHVAIVTFLSGSVWTTEYPVRRTLLGEIVGPENLASGMTFDIATGTAMMFLGPIFGGFLMRDVGLEGFYFVAAVCFAAAFGCIFALRFKPEVAVVTRDSLGRVIADGFRHLRHNQPVAGVLVVTLALNFFGISFISMLPVIGAEKLLLGPVLTGVLMSMEGGGALLGLLLLTIYAAPRYFMRLYVGGAFCLSIAILTFTTLPWLWPALLVLFVGGVGEAGFLAMQGTILFEATPADMRRRVMGLLVACFGAGPLGMLHTGALAEWLGADVAVGVVAAEGLVALVLCLWWWPALRKAAVETPEGV
jgi:MFS family permease